MAPDQVKACLDRLIKGRRPSTGRLSTLKAIAEMGEGWHRCGQVFARAQAKYKVGTNYIFDPRARCPEILEVSEDKTLARLKVQPKLILDIIDSYIDAARRMRRV